MKFKDILELCDSEPRVFTPRNYELHYNVVTDKWKNYHDDRAYTDYEIMESAIKSIAGMSYGGLKITIDVN